MLIAPGRSLGGARPKASVLDTEKRLWIAKFPSHDDTVDIGAWESVTHALARKNEIVGEVKSSVRHWRTEAKRAGIPRTEQDRMATAFRLVDGGA